MFDTNTRRPFFYWLASTWLVNRQKAGSLKKNTVRSIIA